MSDAENRTTSLRFREPDTLSEARALASAMGVSFNRFGELAIRHATALLRAEVDAAELEQLDKLAKEAEEMKEKLRRRLETKAQEAGLIGKSGDVARQDAGATCPADRGPGPG